MFQVRKSSDRGHADHGWLKTHHTFSFSSYQDPRHIHFRALRVMNEDVVAPGQGFGTHPHRDMEIVTYILSGALEHRDSMGNGEILRAGEFQRMTAGTGITHSEFNPSATDPVHLYQIWLFPERKGLTPGYEQKQFAAEERNNQLQLVASREPTNGALTIHQDARIYLADLQSDHSLSHNIPDGRHAWLQVLRGTVTVNSDRLDAGDGVAISEEPVLHMTADSESELMLFDLA
jgi:redox-sensitive bicupin YhaK (pirin superfamily)